MPSTPQDLAKALTSAIINPLITVLFGAALVVFIWGIVEFLWELSNGGDTSGGKMHMLWGIVGLFIMMVAYGILQVIAGTLNLTIPH